MPNLVDRESIVAEIRRAADENGGTPPGSERFAKLTGIRESDWVRYWVRWGDALVEAGFSPNKFVGAYSEEFLLQKLADLVGEIGHFPVTREIKKKSLEDKNFPSEQAFRRVGDKRTLAGKLVQFCADRPDYERIRGLSAPHLESPAEASVQQTTPPAQIGEVYLLRSGRYYKIGKTKSIGRRSYELTIQLPEKPVWIHSIRTDDPSGIEHYWHRRFSDRRKNGEWFELTAEDIAAFRARKSM